MDWTYGRIHVWKDLRCNLPSIKQAVEITPGDIFPDMAEKIMFISRGKRGFARFPQEEHLKFKTPNNKGFKKIWQNRGTFRDFRGVIKFRARERTRGAT